MDNIVMILFGGVLAGVILKSLYEYAKSEWKEWDARNDQTRDWAHEAFLWVEGRGSDDHKRIFDLESWRAGTGGSLDGVRWDVKKLEQRVDKLEATHVE